MNEAAMTITRKYLTMAQELDEDQAFDWLTAKHPEYVDDVLDYLEEFTYNISKNYYRG